MKLYQGTIGPNAKRVRICAAEAGVRLDTHTLDFGKGQLRQPEYLARNPMGKVPTLDDAGFVLWESAAILCYIAQSSGGTLWPTAPREVADTLRWLFFVSCHIDPYYTTLVVERLVKGRQGAPENAVLTGAAEAALARFVPVVDKPLETREYVTGRFGLADIALGCTLEISSMLKFDLAPYPHIRAWLERLQGRQTWKDAALA